MTMQKLLTKRFFKSATLVVAKKLLGCYLCRRMNKKIIRLKIVEVEAYDGPKDKASHASRGQTQRNAPMFGSAGFFYVYFTYGMHWMLNIVTGPKNYPAAILIRGARLKPGQTGFVRSIRSKQIDLGKVSGPARLTKFLGVDKSLNGKPATRKTGLWFEDRGDLINKNDIKRAPRIGVNYAGPVWSKKKYRFLIGKTR